LNLLSLSPDNQRTPDDLESPVFLHPVLRARVLELSLKKAFIILYHYAKKLFLAGKGRSRRVMNHGGTEGRPDEVHMETITKLELKKYS